MIKVKKEYFDYLLYGSGCLIIFVLSIDIYFGSYISKHYLKYITVTFGVIFGVASISRVLIRYSLK